MSNFVNVDGKIYIESTSKHPAEITRQMIEKNLAFHQAKVEEFTETLAAFDVAKG